MAEEKRAGTWKLRGQEPLVAEITVDPKVRRLEGDPYLVYELGEYTTEPAESPFGEFGVRSPGAVKFSAEDVGCFFAESPEQACKRAARFLGRLGQFVAVKGTHVALDFREDDATDDDATDDDATETGATGAGTTEG